METEKSILQSIRNEIEAMNEKFVYNSVSTDDINNKIIDLEKNMDLIVSVLRDISEKLDD